MAVIHIAPILELIVNQLMLQERLQLFAGPFSILKGEIGLARLAVGAEFECPGKLHGTRSKTVKELFYESEFQTIDPLFP